MRLFTVFLFFSLLLISVNGLAQTVLAPGDIALIGANCDDPDDFAFLLLRDIDPGTIIKFTDNGWKADNTFRTGEGILTYTAPSALSAGTVIVYSQHTGDFSSSGSFNLSTGGDQILVYQGDEANPSFIFGLNIEGSPGQWQLDATTSNTSALPLGLVNGQTAVAVNEFDNVKYNGSTSFSSPNAALLSICDKNNWIGDDANRFDFTTFGDFTLPVSLSSFTAIAGDGRVTLRWVTESELGNLGFVLYRGTERDGEYTLISSYESNPALQGQYNSTNRHVYSFTDRLVVNGVTYWYKLADVDANGRYTYHGPVHATPHATGSEIITTGENLPARFYLYPNYPNPFNPSTTLKFDIPSGKDEASRVSLVVFNLLGEQVKTLYQGTLAPGQYEVRWDGRDDFGRVVSGGVYYALLRMNELQRTVKMVFTK